MTLTVQKFDKKVSGSTGLKPGTLGVYRFENFMSKDKLKSYVLLKLQHSTWGVWFEVFYKTMVQRHKLKHQAHHK